MTLYHYENILGMELALYCKTVFFKRFTNRSNFQLLHDIESAKPCTTDRNKSIVSVTNVIFQCLDRFRNIVVLQNHFMASFIKLHHCFTRFLLLISITPSQYTPNTEHGLGTKNIGLDVAVKTSPIDSQHFRH